MILAQPQRPEAESSYDPELDALVVTVFGQRTFEQALGHFVQVVSLMKQQNTRRVLLDLREALYAFDLDQSIEAFRRIAEESDGNQIALVLLLDQREQGIVMQAMASANWNLVRLFHDRGAAEAWLRETLD